MKIYFYIFQKYIPEMLQTWKKRDPLGTKSYKTQPYLNKIRSLKPNSFGTFCEIFSNKNLPQKELFINAIQKTSIAR